MTADTDDLTIERGSGNVFADLGFPQAGAHRLKADLAHQIGLIVKARGLTQVQAGEMTGLGQPDVSRILRGQFRDVSTERLMRMLTDLGLAVDIRLRPRDPSDVEPIHVYAPV